MNPKIEKIIDYFCVIGVNDELVATNKRKSTKNSLITDLELVEIPKELEEVKLTNSKKEKWLNLDGLGRMYLHIIYGGDSEPITTINMYKIQAAKDKCISIPESYNIIPLSIRKYNKQAVFKSKLRQTDKERTYFYYGKFDLTEYLEHNKPTLESENDK